MLTENVMQSIQEIASRLRFPKRGTDSRLGILAQLDLLPSLCELP
jgi:hypothetical protein